MRPIHRTNAVESIECNTVPDLTISHSIETATPIEKTESPPK